MEKRKMCIYVLNTVMSCWEYNNRLSVFTVNNKKRKKTVYRLSEILQWKPNKKLGT